MALKEAEVAEKPVAKALPAIKLVQAEVHGAVDVLGRAAEHSKIPTDATYRTVPGAELSVTIAGNAQKYVSEGSRPLQERFLELVGTLVR